MPGKSFTVLLIEDEPNTRASIKAMLLEMGAVSVYEAKDGQAALSYFTDTTHPVEIVICDWNMPNKTGFELLREIRQTHPTIPFLMITARADANSIMDAKKANVTGYIRKPFSFTELKTRSCGQKIPNESLM